MASVLQTTANVLDQVRFETGKDSNTLTDANLLRSANKWYLWMVREFMDVNEDLYAQLSSTDLVSNQMEYSLAADDAASTYGGGAINVQRVEISYDGVNWYLANPLDLTNVKYPFLEANSGDSTARATLNNNFSKSNPYYAIADRSLWLFPIPIATDSVTAGNANLRMFWIQRPNELATSTIPDFPKDFLNILALGIKADALDNLGRHSEANNAKTEFYQLLERSKQLETNVAEPMIMKRKFETWI